MPQSIYGDNSLLQLEIDETHFLLDIELGVVYSWVVRVCQYNAAQLVEL